MMAYFTIECFKTLKTKSAYILNKNNNNFNLIEKIVYDIAKFHLDNMNLDIQDESICIEFWLKTNGTYIKNMHIDGDDNESVANNGLSSSPFFSTVLYFNDNNNPLFITNIYIESYKYKKFTNKNLYFVFPKKMKNVIFNPKFYHREINIFNEDIDNNFRNSLVLNIWKNHIPLNLPFYNLNEYDNYIFKREDKFINFIKNENFHKIDIKNKLKLDDNFFSDILYKNSDKYYKNFKFIFENNNIYDNTFSIFESENLINCSNNLNTKLKQNFNKNNIIFNLDLESINVFVNFIIDLDNFFIK